jgi:hypothetical protein
MKKPGKIELKPENRTYNKNTSIICMIIYDHANNSAPSLCQAQDRWGFFNPLSQV